MNCFVVLALCLVVVQAGSDRVTRPMNLLAQAEIQSIQSKSFQNGRGIRSGLIKLPLSKLWYLDKQYRLDIDRFIHEHSLFDTKSDFYFYPSRIYDGTMKRDQTDGKHLNQMINKILLCPHASTDRWIMSNCSFS